MKGSYLYVLSAVAYSEGGILLKTRYSGRAEENTFSVVPADMVFGALSVKMACEELRQVIFKPIAFKEIVRLLKDGGK